MTPVPHVLIAPPLEDAPQRVSSLRQLFHPLPKGGELGGRKRQAVEEGAGQIGRASRFEIRAVGSQYLRLALCQKLRQPLQHG